MAAITASSVPHTGPLRYVTDVGYPPTFTPFLSPACDLTCADCGFAPPARGNGFAFCELACGRGVTAAVLCYVTHPEGVFHAVDLMSEHIA